MVGNLFNDNSLLATAVLVGPRAIEEPNGIGQPRLLASTILK